jgi:hypothetical protein
MGDEGLTVFCAAVLELAIRRGIRRWMDLSLHLKTHGYDFKPSRHSNWAYGRHVVDSTLPPALRDALALTDEEAVELATAFAYGQDERITDL